MEVRNSDQLLSRFSQNTAEKPHNYPSHSKDFEGNFGLPLIPNDLPPPVPIVNGNAADFMDFKRQHATDLAFVDKPYDAEAVRQACSSLYYRSTTPKTVLKNASPEKTPKVRDYSKLESDRAPIIFTPKIISAFEQDTNKNRRAGLNEKNAKFSTDETNPSAEAVQHRLKSMTVEDSEPGWLQKQAAEFGDVTGNRANFIASEEKEVKHEQSDARKTFDTALPPKSGSNVAKPILCTSSASSSRRSSLKKKVRFPPEQPKVIVAGHRLLICDPAVE
ncbi:unnamed protein product [Gongylonema pulchrum]|uniref:Uncharacterized protein n=1 Tax=Gongylonema pulchrum TaxID=637853 RepID=A0A183D861_9BILA|nr:unnamed protein product [Gongylonema pulchrum]